MRTAFVALMLATSLAACGPGVVRPISASEDQWLLRPSWGGPYPGPVVWVDTQTSATYEDGFISLMITNTTRTTICVFENKVPESEVPIDAIFAISSAGQYWEYVGPEPYYVYPRVGLKIRPGHTFEWRYDVRDLYVEGDRSGPVMVEWLGKPFAC